MIRAGYIIAAIAGTGLFWAFAAHVTERTAADLAVAHIKAMY